MTRAERLWLPKFLFILAQNEYIHNVNLSKSIHELHVIFFIGKTIMIVTKR